MSSTSPYTPGTSWTFRSLASGYELEHELVLRWEPDGQRYFIRDHDPSHTPAAVLWHRWSAQAADQLHLAHPDRFEPGDAHITWTIRTPDFDVIAEYAPLPEPDPVPEREPTETFLSHFTHPVNSATREPVDWLRLPVADMRWNTGRSDAGRGFIQDALLGWKPAPLQPLMNVHQLTDVTT
ncbi:hypothetical protein [Kitasatospora griseola]|uniref:hypothetical protein n=1 Tax=Kitasatospora griseola TaxID=2064 RepID=UPI0034178E16